MIVENKLYSPKEVKELIISVVEDLYQTIKKLPENDNILMDTKIKQWSTELLPSIEQAVAKEVVTRHVQGVTFSIWAGPPGAGKGTNIDTMKIIGDLYTEIISQGGEARFEEPLHQRLLNLSVDSGEIKVGTGGIFNVPAGEYIELFSKLTPMVGEMVSRGIFPGDDMVSPIVELMLLFRLSQNCHRIQIDLWPRTFGQFAGYSALVKAIKQAGGKLNQEIVNIRVLNNEDVKVISENLASYRDKSIVIGDKLKELSSTVEYNDNVNKGMVIGDAMARYEFEKTMLDKVLQELKESYKSVESEIICKELNTICDRMEFRFKLELEKSGESRKDAFPLSWVKRLMIYTLETSPAFLNAAAESGDSVDIVLTSSFYTPEVVIGEVMEKLIGTTTDRRWEKVKIFAGEIANKLVSKKELIVSDNLKTLEGILRSEV